MKYKVLFVSLAFPPKSDSEALQVAKYFHHLQKHEDLQIDVVTSAVPTLYMPYDPDLEPYAAGAHQTIHVRLRENRYVNFLRNRLGMQESVFPDVKQSFHQQYKKVLRQLKEKPDVIYSRADPKSSTIMAYKLKQALNVPWILHMSDPWADCPVHTMSPGYYRKNDAWERRCFEAADLISVTSVPTVNFYQKKYPQFAHKFRLYPNVFEAPSGEPQAAPEPAPAAVPGQRKFRIIYTGGVVEPIGPGYLLKALQELYEADASLRDRIEVIFAGASDARSRSVLQTYNLPFVSYIGKVPFKEALRLQRSADYLVAVDNPVDDPELAMFFLSKLLDYMVARKRILMLTVKGSASDQVMQDLKGDVCHHHDSAAIGAAVLKALSAFEKGDSEYLVNDNAPRKYEASFNARRLYEDIVSLVTAPAGQAVDAR